MSTEIAGDLSRQTLDLLTRFEARVNSFSGRQDIASLTLVDQPGGAETFARQYFGEGEHVATGVDGSMDFDERLQMMLFYANATAYSCPFTIGGKIEFDLKSTRREARLAASAAVPLWAEDLSSIFANEPEIELELEHSMEKIPNSFMTLGELYLAYLACERAKVLFLDRPISGTFATLSRDARNLLRRKKSMLGSWTRGRRVSMLDLNLAVNLGYPSITVPTRPRYLHLAVLRELLKGPSTASDLSATLGCTEAVAKRAIRRIVKIDNEFSNELLADAEEGRLALRESVTGYWDRVLGMSLSYAEDVFKRRRHPLALGGEDYLTLLDVNTVALFFLLAVCERARKIGTLVVGIAKDTTATDIARAVLPYASSVGFVKLASQPPRLKNDRAFLAILSSENPSVATPWRTMGYDSAFSTIVEAEGRFISARKVVSREQLFVRSYFQLRSLKTDPNVRSQVFLFDRSYDVHYDAGEVRQFKVIERGGETDIGPYFEGTGGNSLSNLVLHILSLTDNPEVFEAFGHNQLLYLADKAVKAEVRMLRSSLRGVADLRVGSVSTRRKIFGLVTPYRQQRSEAEQARRGR